MIQTDGGTDAREGCLLDVEQSMNFLLILGLKIRYV